MNPHVKYQFDEVASRYNQERRQLIPCFDGFYGTAVSLALSDQEKPRVLDIGAGTGLLAGLVQHALPGARLTLIDMSANMLNVARQRFTGAEHEVSYVEADYTQHDFPKGSFDLVVSSLSIHHLEHESKRQLFRSIFRWLAPGGSFVNADQVQGETPNTDAEFDRRWLAAVRASGLREEAIQSSVQRRKSDINAKLGDQLAWLREAGFSDVDCYFKDLTFAVYHGRKEAN